MKKYVGLWILPLTLVLISLGAQKLARSCWDSLVHFRAPQFTLKPEGQAVQISRVVLVVVDGLRLDAFNKMKYVSSLKEKGAYFTLKTGQPSLTFPSSAVIPTGAWQDVTGVTTNWYKGPVKLDSLFTLAKDHGLTTAIVGDEGWGQLFGDAATKTCTRKWENAYITFDEQTLAKALEFLAENPGFLLVHFVDVDNAGHDFGGASPEYQKYAEHIDSLIEKLHENMGEDTDLIVTSDHGQIDRGGHGGWEDVVTHVPLLLYGKMVKPGSYGMAEQTDIAPTMAAILGLPMPPYSQGRILAEALELGGQEARLQELLVEQKKAFTQAYLGAIGKDFARVRGEVRPMPKEGAEHYWDRVFAQGKRERIANERIRHVPLFLIVLLVPVLAFRYFKRKSRLSFRLPFALSLLYFAVFYGIFFATGKHISLSSINDEDLLEKFFNEVMAYAAVAAVLMVIGLAYLERRKDRYEAVKSSLTLVAFISFLIILQADVFFLYNGPLLNWHLPNMFLAFKYYLDLISLVIIGFISVVLPFISMGAHWVSARSFIHR
jgi:hypothetical protein